jgi:hypothetical protein
MVKTQPRPAPEALVPAERKVRLVLLWAGLGVLFLALTVYLLAAWIASGPERTPSGPTIVPTWTKALLVGWQAVGLATTAYFLYAFVIRPWRREGRLSSNGLLLLAMMTLYVPQDLLGNYGQVWVTYSSAMWNAGSWFGHVPGWLAPNGNQMAEPILWAAPFYAYLVFGFSLVGCWIMRKAKTRWPEMGKFGLAMVCFGVFLVLDIIGEPSIMALGFYSYPGGISWMTLFHGKYYQLPVQEMVLFPVFLTACACLLYYRNDRGQTVAEVGIDQVRCTGRKKTGLRFLALAGLLNGIYLVGYNLPLVAFSLQSHAWPEDIIKRSNLTNMLCGPGTSYACPGQAIPINRPDSVHVSPDGTLVVPAGTKLPNQGD